MKSIAMVLATLILWAGGLAAEEVKVTIHVDARLTRVEGVSKHYSVLLGGFSPNWLEVQQGQQVTIELTSQEGLHSLAIPAYGLKTAEVEEGETTSLTFVADKIGEFEIACASKCGGVHKRMKGTLLVVPKATD